MDFEQLQSIFFWQAPDPIDKLPLGQLGDID